MACAATPACARAATATPAEPRPAVTPAKSSHRDRPADEEAVDFRRRGVCGAGNRLTPHQRQRGDRPRSEAEPASSATCAQPGTALAHTQPGTALAHTQPGTA